MKSVKTTAKISSAFAILMAATSLNLSTFQAGRASGNGLQCSATSTGFRVVLSSQGRSLLTVSDASSISQTCEQVAERLGNAINAQGLDRMMLVVDPDLGICIVRSTSQGCRSNNRLLDVPRGMDGVQFLSSILGVSASGFYVGDSGQHTARRYYVKLGEALAGSSSR